MTDTRKFFAGTASKPIQLVRLTIPVAAGKIIDAMDLFLNFKFKGWDMIELRETNEALPTITQAVCQVEIQASNPLTLLIESSKWATERGHFAYANTTKGRFRLRLPNLVGLELDFTKED